MVKYDFKCRNGVDLRPYANKIREEIYSMADLRFSSDEIAYMASLRYMKPDYMEFLRYLRLDPERFIKKENMAPRKKV
jgi:nicotinate phosphoribosyltransferase